jgi:phosphoribosyl 1,2-cyclic phosphodiesterase
MSQIRCTGGMLIDHGNGRVHMDPGPGALTQMHRTHTDPRDTDTVMISHCHPDHYSDAACVIEGMTEGGWKRRGRIFGSPTVIEGRNGLGPCLSKYHLGVAESYGLLIPGETVDLDGTKVEIKRADHSDPTNVGFVFDSPWGKVAYVSDTAYSDEIADQYRGCRVLILPVTTPLGERIKFHLCTDDAITFIERVRPELAIFIHLGVVILQRDPDKEAAIAQERTDVRTVAGKDLMVLEVGEEISFSEADTFDDDWFPDWFPRSNGKSISLRIPAEPGHELRYYPRIRRDRRPEAVPVQGLDVARPEIHHADRPGAVLSHRHPDPSEPVSGYPPLRGSHLHPAYDVPCRTGYGAVHGHRAHDHSGNAAVGDVRCRHVPVPQAQDHGGHEYARRRIDGILPVDHALVVGCPRAGNGHPRAPFPHANVQLVDRELHGHLYLPVQRHGTVFGKGTHKAPIGGRPKVMGM